MMDVNEALFLAIFISAFVTIVPLGLVLLIGITKDINAVIGKCDKIGKWAKDELERRNDG